MRTPCCVAAAAAALLTVAQVASAYVVPSAILLRTRRAPVPMRSFSFSGFNPDGQMAAFTGLADYPAFVDYGPHYGQAGPHHGRPPSHDSYGPPQPPPVQDSYGPPPSGSATSSGQAERVPKPDDWREQRPSDNGVEPMADDGKKRYGGRGGGGGGGGDGPSSNAEASFNAWFPIMFGVFPNGGGGGGSSGNAADGSGNSAGSRGNPYGSERSSSGSTTVIANSVSNGRHGVATSHAIAYGNPRSSSPPSSSSSSPSSPSSSSWK